MITTQLRDVAVMIVGMGNYSKNRIISGWFVNFSYNSSMNMTYSYELFRLTVIIGLTVTYIIFILYNHI